MDSPKSFLEFVNKFIPLTQDEFDELILPCVVTRTFEKKTIITRLGEVEEYFNFINSGLARLYYIDEKEEINAEIAFEGQVIYSSESFHSRIPSEYIIETIEPCEMTAINYECLERLYSSSKRMERLGRLVITDIMVAKDKWQTQLIKLSPRERFLNFVMNNPELLQRVPQKYLASYLNIKPETFSRFKHLIKEHVRKSYLESI